jgi:succinoglycan biosynthesis protein ExoA
MARADDFARDPAAAMPPPAIDCSVLIPVLNEERHIERSVAVMRRQRFPGRLEFLFADGGSTDRTRVLLDALAREDDRIRVFDNPRRTASSGLNVALRHARGRWIARMDAHTSYPEDYVALGVARLLQGGTRWVSGPQTPTGHDRVSRAVALALGSPLGRGGSRKWGRIGQRAGAEFELDSGVFAGVWARETLLEYGGWDERSSPNEDSELAGRFLGRGERLICIPEMAAHYVPRDSLRGLWRQYQAYGEARFRTANWHPHTLRRSHLLPPALVLDVALAAAGVGGPRVLRRAARLGLGLYAVSLAGAAFQTWGNAEQPADALAVPAVLAVMHLANGLGALRGAVRNGPPLAALVSLAGRDGAAGALARPPERVFAPSLV